MKTYSSKQLRQLVAQKKWIMAYNRLTAVVDDSAKKVMYIEEYGPQPGFFVEGWRALHFPLTSEIVERSYREGNTTIYIIKQGRAKVNLTPSFAPIGIEECRVVGKKVLIVVSGLGGGGVSASFSRGMADGVSEIRVIEEGGGKKMGKGGLVLPLKKILLIGVDDTDKETEGATYALVHNISLDIADENKVWYCVHNNIQLYPYNPNKTKNCMGTVVGFIYDNISKKNKIINHMVQALKKYSLTDRTGIAIYDGFSLPQDLVSFSESLKFRMLTDINEIYNIADKTNVNLIKVTGERGLIGAVASLGLYDRPEYAAKLPIHFRN